MSGLLVMIAAVLLFLFSMLYRFRSNSTFTSSERAALVAMFAAFLFGVGFTLLAVEVFA